MEALPSGVILEGFVWTWIVPAGLFTLAAIATWLLYRHFSNKDGDE